MNRDGNFIGLFTAKGLRLTRLCHPAAEAAGGSLSDVPSMESGMLQSARMPIGSIPEGSALSLRPL
ncbi:hypothetical protein EMIT053CA3_210098 [Pseudomonas donghuensis]